VGWGGVETRQQGACQSKCGSCHGWGVKGKGYCMSNDLVASDQELPTVCDRIAQWIWCHFLKFLKGAGNNFQKEEQFILYLIFEVIWYVNTVTFTVYSGHIQT
jgi:hypothetical protein